MTNQDNRYSRQLLLPGFGVEAQQKLQQARVLVIGAGGLGVPALQYLAGMGIGTIGIADGDVIMLSNLHRQVLYANDDVGKLKVKVAAQKLAALNPSINVITYQTAMTVSNALNVIAAYDVVIDATDNFAARYLINDACVLLDKPFVYGAVHQYEGQVSVFNFQQGPTYRCLYPVQPSPHEIPDCNTAGVLGVVPGIVGCHQALEAVKMIAGIGTTLSGYVQVFDFLHNDQYKIKLTARPESRYIRQLQTSYTAPSCTPVNLISVTELHHWYATKKKFLLMDVREPDETKHGYLEAAMLIPLQTLDTWLDNLPGAIPLVTICRQGGRSLNAAARITEKLPGLEVYSVTGGMEEWLNDVGDKFIVT